MILWRHLSPEAEGEVPVKVEGESASRHPVVSVVPSLGVRVRLRMGKYVKRQETFREPLCFIA